MNHREQMRRRRGAGVAGDDCLTGTAAMKPPASVELRIERLILDGVAPGDRYDIADAVGSELARLLAQQSVAPANLNPALTARRIDAGRIDIDNGMGAARVGEQIARAIHGCLGSITSSSGKTQRS